MTHTASLSDLAPAVYNAMRAAGHPCPSGDGYPVAALNIHRHLSLAKSTRSHPHALLHLGAALALALDVAEGTDPGGFHATVQVRQPGATGLSELRGPWGADDLHAALARCTESWHLTHQHEDGSAGLTAHLTNLIAGLSETLQFHGAHPETALSDVDYGATLLPGRPE